MPPGAQKGYRGVDIPIKQTRGFSSNIPQKLITRKSLSMKRIGDIDSVIGEGILDVVRKAGDLAFGPIGTKISNIISEKFNKNPE